MNGKPSTYLEKRSILFLVVGILCLFHQLVASAQTSPPSMEQLRIVGIDKTYNDDGVLISQKVTIRHDSEQVLPTSFDSYPYLDSTWFKFSDAWYDSRDSYHPATETIYEIVSDSDGSSLFVFDIPPLEEIVRVTLVTIDPDSNRYIPINSVNSLYKDYIYGEVLENDENSITLDTPRGMSTSEKTTIEFPIDSGTKINFPFVVGDTVMLEVYNTYVDDPNTIHRDYLPSELLRVTAVNRPINVHDYGSAGDDDRGIGSRCYLRYSIGIWNESDTTQQLDDVLVEYDGHTIPLGDIVLEAGGRFFSDLPITSGRGGMFVSYIDPETQKRSTQIRHVTSSSSSANDYYSFSECDLYVSDVEKTFNDVGELISQKIMIRYDRLPTHRPGELTLLEAMNQYPYSDYTQFEINGFMYEPSSFTHEVIRSSDERPIFVFDIPTSIPLNDQPIRILAPHPVILDYMEAPNYIEIDTIAVTETVGTVVTLNAEIIEIATYTEETAKQFKIHEGTVTNNLITLGDTVIVTSYIVDPVDTWPGRYNPNRIPDQPEAMRIRPFHTEELIDNPDATVPDIEFGECQPADQDVSPVDDEMVIDEGAAANETTQCTSTRRNPEPLSVSTHFIRTTDSSRMMPLIYIGVVVLGLYALTQKLFRYSQ